jgi:hypothetical protein
MRKTTVLKTQPVTISMAISLVLSVLIRPYFLNLSMALVGVSIVFAFVAMAIDMGGLEISWTRGRREVDRDKN